jgi:hypothetical protein
MRSLNGYFPSFDNLISLLCCQAAAVAASETAAREAVILIAVFSAFAASKREPLINTVERVHAAPGPTRVIAVMQVLGMLDEQGFKATLLLPVAPRASHGQVAAGRPNVGAKSSLT